LNTIVSDHERQAAELLKSLDPAQVGAAVSKFFAASIGDMAVVFFALRRYLASSCGRVA
jgi:hypothetical protein